MRIPNYSKSNKNDKKYSERGARTRGTQQYVQCFLSLSSYGFSWSVRAAVVRSWSDRSGHQLSSSLWSFCWQVRPCKIHPPKTLPQIHGSWRLLKTKIKHCLTIVMLGVHQSDTNTPLHGGITFPHLSCCFLLAASIQLPVTEELLRISCHTLIFLQ